MGKYLLRAGAILLAAVMLSGCSLSKTNSSDEEPFVSEDSAPKQNDEPVFQELTEADFTEIEVNVSVNEAADLPIEMNTLEIKNVDFGARISPCKKEDVRDQFIEENIRERNAGANVADEWIEFHRNYLTDLCSLPAKGIPWVGAFHGDMAYFGVLFDDLCNLTAGMSGHEWSIFSCDTTTGKTQELWNYSSTEQRVFMSSMRYCQGKLYFIVSYFDHTEEVSNNSVKTFSRNVLMELDPDTGEAKEIASGMSGESDEIGYLIDTKSDRLFFAVYDSREPKNTITTIREYDPASGEFSDIVSGNDIGIPYCGCEGIAYSERTEDRKTRVVTDWYTVDTGVTASLSAANDHRFYLHGTDMYNNTIIYCYDLNQREKYKLNVSGIGGLFSISGDYVLTSTGMFNYCLIPDLGAAFPVPYSDGARTFVQHDGDRAYYGDYGTYQGGWEYITDDTGHISLDVKPETTQDLTITWFES